MKKNETKEVKPKLIKDVNEDTDQVKKFILLLFGIAIISGLLYFLTAKYLIKDEFQKSSTDDVEEVMTYDNVNVGNVFNRPYDKYYVFAFDREAIRASYYQNLFGNFSGGDTKIYSLDLSKGINAKYASDESNKSATKPSELKIKSPTLMLIEKGKITEYYDTEDEIVKILK